MVRHSCVQDQGATRNAAMKDSLRHASLYITLACVVSKLSSRCSWYHVSTVLCGYEDRYQHFPHDKMPLHRAFVEPASTSSPRKSASGHDEFGDMCTLSSETATMHLACRIQALPRELYNTICAGDDGVWVAFVVLRATWSRLWQLGIAWHSTTGCSST